MIRIEITAIHHTDGFHKIRKQIIGQSALLDEHCPHPDKDMKDWSMASIYIKGVANGTELVINACKFRLVLDDPPIDTFGPFMQAAAINSEKE